MTDSEELSPLAIAIKNGNTELERYLRNQGCTLSDNDDKQELLFTVCEHGQLDTLKDLLESCDVTSKQ